jgi:quercetin dioxygenase-like cupin family protein
MKIIRFDELKRIANPTPGTPHRPEIKLDADRFKNLGGMFGLLPPGTKVPYHFHRERESILIPVSGEAVEIVEGAETAVGPGDMLLIPAGEKHTIENRSRREFRFVEFFTCPPLAADFVKVE